MIPTDSRSRLARKLQRLLSLAQRKLGGSVQIWAMPAAVMGAAIVVRLVIGPLIIDDAYIYFRYAVNAAAGRGLVYNIGERVLGVTSPLYVVLLSVLARTGANLVIASALIGIACDAGTTLLITWIGRKTGSTTAGIVGGALFALAPKAVLPGLSGMETPVFTFLVIGSCACLASRSDFAAFSLAGLASIARPEGLLLCACVLIEQGWRRRRFPAWGLVICGFPAIAWTVFSRAYYGRWIPHSITAKATVYPRYPDLLHDGILIVRYVTNPFESTASSPSLGLVNLAIGLLVAAGAVVVVRRSHALTALAAWGVFLAVAYGALNRFLFPWYLAPLFPLSGLMIGMAVCAFFESKRSMDVVKRLFPRSLTVLKTGVGGVLVVGLVASLALSSLATKLFLSRREEVYLRFGTWLSTHTSSNYTLASPEIGALGYTYPGRILDLTGLVSPEVLPYYKDPDFVFRYPFSVPHLAISTFRPPVLVAYDLFIEPLLANPAFKSAYPNMRVLQQPIDPFGTLMVFTGPGVPLPP